MTSVVLNEGAAIGAYLEWNGGLPAIPDAIGFAGSFAGVSNGTLLVAGGANFPDGGTPWTGSVKVWHDQIFALEQPEGEWKVVGRLPHPLGYGASVTWKDAFIVMGGSDEKGHYADVWKFEYINGEIVRTALPSLPAPIANTSAVLAGDVIYIAGGLGSADAKNSANNCWCLDLSAEPTTWKILDPWPGPSRMFAVTGACDGNFYLFSGATLENGNRHYLKDAYQYTAGKGWTKLADLPHAVVAAPATAYAAGPFNLQIFGGDDGAATAVKEKHPGFSREILNYNTITNTWTIAGLLPAGPAVTTSLAVWNGHVVIPGGEVRPAVRTTKVLTGNPKHV